MTTDVHGPPGPPRPGGPAAPGTVAVLRGFLTRGSRLAVLCVCVPVALLGALTSPPTLTLVVGPLFGFFSAGVTALINPDFPAARSARRAAVRVGVFFVVLVPFMRGLEPLGAVGVGLATALVFLGSVRAACWLVTAGADSEDDDGDLPWLQEVLSELPTEVLLEQWRATEGGVRDPDESARRHAIALRGLLLDELARRDGEGTERWLRHGGPDPAPFIDSDRGRAG